MLLTLTHKELVQTKKMIWLVVLFLILCYLCYLLYVPVPDGLSSEERFMYRMGHYFVVAYFRGARLYGYFNGKPYVVNCQTLLKRYAKEPKQESNSHIQVSKVILGDAEAILYRNLRQKPGEKCPALVYIHGGAYVIGSPLVYDSFMRDCCDKLGCCVFTLYYPLAPDSTFPAPYVHVLEACTWLLKNSQKFLIDPERMAIAGDSIGGQFAASVVQDLKADPSVGNFKLQLFIYSLFQWIDMNTPSYQHMSKLFGENIATGNFFLSSCLSFYLLGKEDWRFVKALARNRLISDATRQSKLHERLDHGQLPVANKNPNFYRGPIEGPCDTELSNQFESLLLDHRLSPIMGDLEGLPMAYVASCGLDCLMDDSFLFCSQLEKAGVKVVHKHYEKAMHGQIGADEKQSKIAGQMRREFIEFLEQNL